ncbi:NACHT domain-containing NTPase [Microbacterium sp. KSW4-4]|uniref:NACHT domain-containing protein n=1 Tax=Microbacterium sp. KSW4-4 TaxID=2851651 RepID=UPI001FFD52AE|nr:hypothetical protein [Microbacterium sp. KSW4-4]MCK2032210.1 hypothetical protein [Microbacterium sp. KSW4-4]
MLDLKRFDATAFQDLAATLAVAEFGAGVRSMGSGRDGGRDLICEDEMVWSTPGMPGQQRSSGYTVLQVKHMQTPSDDHGKNVSWLWGEIRDELDAWSRKADRQRTPNTLVFVTNVRLTPFPGSGGFDILQQQIRTYVGRVRRDAEDEADDERRMIGRARADRLERISRFHFWDYYQIEALVHAHPGVRHAHTAFLTPGDVLATIPSLLNLVREENLEDALRSHARTTLMTGGRIYFDEAGAIGDAGMPVHEVMVDLPTMVPSDSPSGRRLTTILPYVLERSGRVLKPQTTRVAKPRHIIVSGAPGNGKTTLSKMIVQAHRAAFLRESTALSDEQRATIAATDEALRQLGVNPPTYPRWPMQINLAEFAQDEALDFNSTLIRRISNEVSAKSDTGDIAPNLLNRWRTQWPWLVVLDGFDEVVDPALRKRIIEQITEFANDCEADNSDTLILLTTRPLGFTEQIGTGLFERVDLTDLSPRTALDYGEKVTSVRLSTGPERRDRVIRRLRAAAEDDAFENLLKTPLQVLILSIIVEQAGELEPDRFSLFHGYFHTVMSREKGKPGGFSSLIRDYSALIEHIHQRVGIELQTRSERGETTLSLITAQELHDIIWTALKQEEFDPDSRDRQLLADIKNAATQRLVLIAPHGEDGYGFDVRLLQEYMAGQYIGAATEKVVGDRLRLAAPNPHWRQTWLFTAGRMFTQPTKHLQELVVGITENIDDDAPQRLGGIYPVGPQLAMDILMDGMSRARPIWLKRLVARALDLLDDPAGDPRAQALALVKIASINEHTRSMVADGLRERLRPSAKQSARVVLRHWLAACEVAEASTPVRGISHIKPPPGGSAPTPSQTPDRGMVLNPEQQALFDSVMPSPDTTRGQIRLLRSGLKDETVAREIERALPAALLKSNRLHRIIENDVISRVVRRPIGQMLIDEDHKIDA